MAIQIKDLDQLKSMRKANLLVRSTLELVKENIRAGITTSALDAIAEANIKRGGGTSNFKGYHGYPAVICTSVNEEIVHGIPSDRMLLAGDVISVDCGAIIDGWHGDAAFTVIVESEDIKHAKMLEVCAESLWQGIAAGVLGAKISDIGHAIEKYINSQGTYGILREYGGHGIGNAMHMEPHILNFGKPGHGPTIEAGMVFAIEPMITMGAEKVRTLDDNWTVVTIDNSFGCHFEASYCIAPDGKPFVLSAPDGGAAELARFGIEVSTLLS